ncbi:hypothetical protein LJR029_005850 [Caballeronia sp. LjRoot29]|uniref:hypothetical protein n=1 Tax=Caballeronia sp. LjRoot29 TaxID=3342315 RepID=UPI003ECFF903
MQVGFKRNSFLVWAVMPAIFTVLVIWYQFGFSLGAMLEEWDVLALIQKHPAFWSSFPGQLLSDKFAARPLQTLPHFVANLISPDSFVGFHVVLMIACLLRVIGAASLGNFLFRNKAYAAAFGVLCFVFPADTQQFEFRTVHIVLAVGMMVFSSGCTIQALYAETAWKRWTSLLSAVIFSCVAVLIYEPVISLYSLTPLSILAREGFRRSFRLLLQRKLIIGAWLAGPFINSVYLFYAIVIFKSSYQVSASNGGMADAVAHNFHYLMDSGAYRIFYDAWASTWWILTEQFAHYRYAMFIGAALVGSLILLTEGSRTAISLARTARFLIAGLILLIAGYLPFMVAESHMVINQRTFIAVAPGASLIIIAFISFIFQRQNAVGAVVAAGFIFMGFVQQLYQFDRYTRDYTNIVLPYTSMLEDKTDPAKRVHLVFDRSGVGGHLNGMYFSKVANAASVRRREDDGLSILCMYGQSTSALPHSACSLKNGKWIVRSFDGVVTDYPEAEVQVITIGPAFDSSYRSHRASWKDFGTFVEAKSLFATGDPHIYQCEADSMWGYSGFCRGEGWSDGIFDHTQFQHVNYFVATARDSSLMFPLSPLNKPYVLRAAIFGGFRPDFLSQIKLTINDHEVPINVIDGQFLEAEISSSLLKAGQNEIRFLNVISPKGQTAMALSKIILAPTDSQQLLTKAAKNRAPMIRLDQWQLFNSDEIRPMLRYGFSATETKGTWTDGKSAEIAFRLPIGTKAGTFVAEAIPFFNDSHSRLDVAISINGQSASSKILTAPAKPEQLNVPFTLSDKDADGPVVVTITFNQTAKPSPQDQRDLALYFFRFKVAE